MIKITFFGATTLSKATLQTMTHSILDLIVTLSTITLNINTLMMT